MELYLIRHAQSTNNATNEQNRVADPGLTDIGFKQAEAVAHFLKTGQSVVDGPVFRRTFGITKLYCSPMLRTLQTCQPISQALGMRPEVWIEIHEHGGVYLDFRDEETGTTRSQGYTGLKRSEILQQFADYTLPENLQENGWWNAEQGEEALTGAQSRAIKVAAALLEQAETKERIALVTHGTFIDCLIKAFLHMLPNTRHYFGHNNTGITRFDFFDRERMTMRFINRIDHLPLDLIT